MKLALKMSPLDILPPQLTRSDKTLPNLLTHITNLSFSSGEFPASLKHAIITPVIKKVGLDSEDLRNFRPISNLTLVNKLIERIASKWLENQLEISKWLHPFQSAYRKSHSTETALLRVVSDWKKYLDEGKSVCVASLDVTAAFDTVNHHLLLDKLSASGVRGIALTWFSSYLTHRTMAVKVGECVSKTHVQPSGVPQGSTLGPILFNVYVADLLHTLSTLSVHFHMYADDLLLYVPFSHSDMPESFTSLQLALNTTEKWMTENCLLLSALKTNVRILHLPKVLPMNLPSLQIGGLVLDLSSKDALKWLGVEIDTALTMKTFVDKTCRACFFHLHMIRSIRHSLDEASTLLLCNSLILSRLDYANSLLALADNVLIQKLRRVLHLAARTVKRCPRSAHISPVLQELRWCPIEQRSKFKVLCLVYKSLCGLAPNYLAQDLIIHVPRRAVRSSDSIFITLELGSSKRKIGQSTFQTAAPMLWNSLPPEIRTLRGSTLDSFMNNLLNILLDSH
jgi:hypothetical protein